MPDKNGKITQEEADKILTYLDQKFPDGLKCAACHVSEWNLEENTVTPIVMGPGGLRIMGTINTYPQVALMCRNCGHTMFFSAIPLGLFVAEKAAENPAEVAAAKVSPPMASRTLAASSITRSQAGSLRVEDIPQGPVRGAWVTAERLGMLATARRNGLGDASWATLSGVLASAPATIHDLIEAYWQASPTGLSDTRLIDVGVTAIFIGLFIGSLFFDRGKRAAALLKEILNPDAASVSPNWWQFWKN